MGRILVFDAEKLRKIRGSTPRRVIVERSGGKISIQQLYNWEMGVCGVRMHLIPALMRGLGIQHFEQIASPLKDTH
jgi:hypothetical protein